jgi:hypothetical protein
MSYCANGDTNAWLSPRNWNRAFSVLAAKQAELTNPRTADRTAARAAQAGQAFVIGTAGPDGGRIVRVVAADPGNAALPLDPSSPLTVRTLGPSGNVLSEAGARIQPLHLDGATGAATFALSIPAGAAAVELVRYGTVVDRRVRTRPPTVRVLGPGRGSRVSRSLTVRWSASDPDHEPLQARVGYAANGASGWRTVFLGPSGGHATIPGRFLEAGSNARIRVFVNDGFNQASARSAAFRVTGSAPRLRS